MKKEVVILLAVIAALAGYLMVGQTGQTHYDIPKLSSLQTTDVDRLEIRKGDDLLLLEKIEEEWAVDMQGFPGRRKTVEDLVETASKLTLTELISESGNPIRYQLGPEQAKTVSLFKGETRLRVFSVGKTAPSNRHTFVMLNEKPEVYLAMGNFSDRFRIDPEAFIDKAVLLFKVDAVSGFSIAKGKSTLAAKRVSGPPKEEGAAASFLWQNEKGQTLELTKVQNLLATLSSLSCEKWLTQREGNTTEATDGVTITIMTDRPTTLTLKADQTATTNEKPFPFTLSEATQNSLTQSLDALFSPPETKAQEPKPEGT